MIDLDLFERIATGASDDEKVMEQFLKVATPLTVMKMIWVIKVQDKGLRESCCCAPEEPGVKPGHCDACMALETARKILAEE